MATSLRIEAGRIADTDVWPEATFGFTERFIAARAIPLDMAEGAGFTQLGEKLRRAARTVAVPTSDVLRICAALRPHRRICPSIQALADEIETRFDSKAVADRVREAAEVYQGVGLLGNRGQTAAVHPRLPKPGDPAGGEIWR